MGNNSSRGDIMGSREKYGGHWTGSSKQGRKGQLRGLEGVKDSCSVFLGNRSCKVTERSRTYLDLGRNQIDFLESGHQRSSVER